MRSSRFVAIRQLWVISLIIISSELTLFSFPVMAKHKYLSTSFPKINPKSKIEPACFIITDNKQIFDLSKICLPSNYKNVVASSSYDFRRVNISNGQKKKSKKISKVKTK